MKAPRPVRVLHTIAGLGGGGSERLVWDVVRLSDPTKTVNLVVTVFPHSKNHVYAERLASAGAHVPLTGLRPLTQILDRARKESTSPGRARGLWRFLYASAVLGQVLVATPHIASAYRRFRPDVINGHTSYGFIVGAILALVGKRPFICVVPASIAQLDDESHQGWIKHVYRHLHGIIHRFVTAMPNELRALGVPQDKVKALSGRIDVSGAKAAIAERERHRRDVRRRLNIGQDSTIALSVGRLHPSKGHHFAADAINLLGHRLPHLHWVVLGEGSEAESLRSHAARLGLEGRTHFLGFQPEPLPYYAAADIYLRTTTLEAENLSSYQAMATALPVVGFDTGNETELLREVGHGLLVPLGDVPAFAAAMQCILESSDRGQALGLLGAAYAQDVLDVRRTAQQFTELNREATFAGVIRSGNSQFTSSEAS